ncbi:23S rRNA (guanosine(2251)-2'-O)-methyltransferase RlmB [Aureitalea marina]|uniref:23S rRNA (Guanosine(2251)-2'-O)-methyltransferase RlmB n=1 Tax=Aureitalea marina TaxID=930804 RepID=A0A2S7KQQ4_9FLAO|nr:23S rRNA (guanosine(2251)-2'-O)-methyltransferase RlmB [Aureitalea marina]PQB04952.1 23S rRNA (guanosine(2251)-2'-O)-methyltransferase RlmB [Aureitalea marina]
MKREFTVFGIYPVIEAIKSGKSLDKLYVIKDSQNPKIDQILQLVQESDTTVVEVPVEKLDRLTRSNHQGVVATLSPISFISLDDLVENSLEKPTPGLILVLDQITDVRNFGAIIRTAESTGVDGIIIQKKSGAPVSGDTVKTSAGAVFNVPICKVDHIKDAIYYLQGSGFTTLAATEKAQQDIYTEDLSGSVALIMGSEGRGIAPSVLKIVDTQVKLPMLGKINSLNVSVACGVCLYEIVRQRL